MVRARCANGHTIEDTHVAARYCRECGEPLFRLCSNGHTLRENAAFCGVCGATDGTPVDVPGVARPPLAPGAAASAASLWPAPPAPAVPSSPAPPPLRPPPPAAPPKTPKLPVGDTVSNRRRSRELLVVGIGLLVVVAAGVGVFFATRPPGKSHDTQKVSAPHATSTSTTTSPQSTTTPLPPGEVSIDTSQVAGSPLLSDITPTLEAYFGGIDSQDYSQAYDATVSSLSGNGNESGFAAGESTSSDTGISVASVTQNADGSISAAIDFTSHQAPGDGPVPGETCTNWTLEYQFDQETSNGATAPDGTALTYFIESVTSLGPGNAPC